MLLTRYSIDARGLLYIASLGCCPTADATASRIVSARWAEFSTKKNNLKMEFIPFFLGENPFQIAFGLHHALARRETPACCQTVNVRIDRKARNIECLSE